MNKQEAGRLGGRPRLPTLDELRQQQLSETRINMKEGMDTPGSNDYKVLRRLYLQRCGSNSKINHTGRDIYPH